MFSKEPIKQFLKPEWRKILITLTLVFVISPHMVGASIPCGRAVDNPETLDFDETTPCGLCPVFYNLKTNINLAIEISFIVGLLALVVLCFAKIAYKDNLAIIKKVRSIVKFILSIVAAIFIIWIIVAYLLQETGYQSMFIWNQINCNE